MLTSTQWRNIPPANQFNNPDFETISELFYMELQFLNKTPIRYVLKGFPNFETAKEAITKAYIIDSGFQLLYDVALDNGDYEQMFTDTVSDERGTLKIGRLEGNQCTFSSGGITAAKKRIQKAYQLYSHEPNKNDMDNPTEFGDTEEKQIEPEKEKEKSANVSLWIAPCKQSVTRLIGANYSDFHFQMGTAILTQKDLEKKVQESNADPSKLRKALFRPRLSYNSRDGRGWFENLIKGLCGRETTHITSGSTRGDEAYFSLAGLRYVDYKTFRQRLLELISGLKAAEIDHNNLKNKIDDFNTAIEKFLGDDVLHERIDDPKKCLELFMGVHNTHDFLEIVTQKYGQDIAELIYRGIGSTDYAAFWLHDGYVKEALCSVLEKNSVTRLSTFMMGTDPFKDTDDIVVFLSIIYEFLLNGTVAGIPCDSINFYSATDVYNQRAQGMQNVLVMLMKHLQQKHEKNQNVETCNSIEENYYKISIAPGFDAVLKDDGYSYYQHPDDDETKMPVSIDGNPSPTLNIGGLAAIFLLKDFNEFVEALHITFQDDYSNDEFCYKFLHTMWRCSWDECEYQNCLPKEDFELMAKNLRQTLNNQHKKNNMPQALAQNVIKDTFSLFIAELKNKPEFSNAAKDRKRDFSAYSGTSSLFSTTVDQPSCSRNADNTTLNRQSL